MLSLDCDEMNIPYQITNFDFLEAYTMIKKKTIDGLIYMNKYVYNVSSFNNLQANMPNTKLQISNVIEAFNDNIKAEFETVHHKYPCI